MTEAIYTDDVCWYCGGDLRLEVGGPTEAIVSIGGDVITIVLKDRDDTIRIPRNAVLAAENEEHCAADLSHLNEENRITEKYIAQYDGVSWDQPGVTITVTDPEGVYEDGLKIAVICRNDYYAKVLAKRLREAPSL